MDAIRTDTPTIEELNRKIDFLTEQLMFVTAELRHQQERRLEWEELKSDATPIINDLFRISVEQLEEVESYVQFEDILHLFKRLLRNTRNLEQMLDQLESVMELWGDISPLTQNAFLSMMDKLDEMERKGYFTFAQGAMKIMDNVVTSFTEEDVQQLGDNIVLILETIKEMTQPEILTMLRSTVQAAQQDETTGDVSLLGILRQLNDPAVKRGLARTLNVLKTVADN